MSTATFPTGMRPYPSGGYAHHRTLFQFPYISWKGEGLNRYPSANTAGHVRPLTNNDSGNVFAAPFGRPRPIKHYRRARQVYRNLEDDDQSIRRNLERFVKSGVPTPTLSSGLVEVSQNMPGSVSVRENTAVATPPCIPCRSIQLIASYAPNLTNLSETPNKTFPCCNQEKYAKQRVIYASTVISPKYFTTSKQLMQNRCRTYDQKSFNFQSNRPIGPNAYLANCYATTSAEFAGCKKTIYKPSNRQFSVQGAVSSSARMLKLNKDTITTNASTNPSNKFINTSCK